jgi:hypothetical protein
LATTHGSATWPDALRPVHRHNEGARELPIGWRSSTGAVALRLAVSIRLVGDVRCAGVGPDRAAGWLSLGLSAWWA